MKVYLAAAVFMLASFSCWAGPFPKVDADIATYDHTVAQYQGEFEKQKPNPHDKEWVKAKLAHMVKVDQYMRLFPNVIYDHKYTADETKDFWEQFASRGAGVDSRNTADLKELLKIYEWFKISDFGAEADENAWLLVQHADQDVPFQKQILALLEKLYRIGETKPANYAYLFDRVATSPSDPAKRTLQRYGTQGRCVGVGLWEPWAMEDPEHVDARRASVGLSTMAEYKKLFKDICRSAD